MPIYIYIHCEAAGSICGEWISDIVIEFVDSGTRFMFLVWYKLVKKVFGLRWGDCLKDD